MQFVCFYIVFFNLTPSPLCFEKIKSKFLGPLGGPSLEKKRKHGCQGKKITLISSKA